LWRELGDDYAVARVLGDLSSIAMREGRYADAAAALVEGAGICRRLGDRRAFVTFTTKLAAVAQRRADYAGARSVLEELRNASRDFRDPVLEAQGLVALGDVWWAEGDHTMAQRLFEEAVALGRTLDRCWPLFDALQGLGVLALERDDVVQARRCFQEAADAVQREAPGMDDPLSAASLAHVALAEGDRERAKELCRPALAVVSTMVSRPQILAVVLDLLTVILAQGGELERATMLACVADEIHGRTVDAGFTPQRSLRTYERARWAMRDGLDDASHAAAHAAGAELPLQDVLAQARSALE